MSDYRIWGICKSHSKDSDFVILKPFFAAAHENPPYVDLQLLDKFDIAWKKEQYSFGWKEPFEGCEPLDLDWRKHNW